MTDKFDNFARRISDLTGHPIAFFLGVAVILVWLSFGPMLEWSDWHQLIVNTGTTIITFLMVFLIQNTQSRDTRAIQLKLDELIRVSAARNEIMHAEEASREELDRLKRTMERDDG